MILKRIIPFALFAAYALSANADNAEVRSFGHFKKMIHQKNTDGVVDLNKALPSANAYAVGASHKGMGEITIINSQIWLDYGKDGLGNASNSIPDDEQATLLAVSEVKEWQSIEITDGLSKQALFEAILERAKANGLDVDAPFPFLLEGVFKRMMVHVINGENPKFGGHGSKQEFFIKAQEERTDQQAIVVGFYSASTQGLYTHPGESWHLHAVIRDENIGAHIDDIATNDIVLKLPQK